MNNNFVLKNGQFFVLAEAAGGVYNCDQIKKISEVAEEDSAILKITEDQRIGFMISEARFTSAQKALAAQGIILQHYRGSGVIAPKTCLGELCPHAQQDALGDAVELEASLMEIFPEPKRWLSIGLNGCDQSCTGSALDDIHIVGEETGYKIAIAGRTREFPQLGQFLCENITKDKLVESVRKIIEVYFENQEGEERLCDVVERVGMSVFMAATDSLTLSETEETVSSEEVSSEELPMEEMSTEEPMEEISMEELPMEEISTEDSLEAPILEEDALDVPIQEDNMDTAVQEDSMDVPIQDDTMEAPALEADTMEEELVDDMEEIPMEEDTLETPVVEEELVDDMEEMTDMTTDVDTDIAIGSEIIEVDVDEEIRTTIKERISLTKELNSDIDNDLSPDTGDEELMLDDDVQLSLKETEAAALEDSEDIPIEDTEEEISGSDNMVTDEEGLINEDSTDTMEYEEGTQDDVKRMTQALRSESPRSTTPPVSAPKASAPVSTPAPTGRLKIKMGANEVKVTLPSGVECAVPLDWINSCGAFEMDIESQTLIIEKQGEMLKFQYGTLVLSLPLALSTLSAA